MQRDNIQVRDAEKIEPRECLSHFEQKGDWII